jgi:hypothetical protein
LFERAGGVELGDLRVEEHSLPGVGADDDAHGVAGHAPALAGAIEVPGSAHEHMGDEDQVA